MTTTGIITVCANVCAIFITAIILVGAIIGRNTKGKVNRYFLAMLISNLAGSVYEIVLSVLLRTPASAAPVLIRLVDLADFSCASLVIIFFGLYMYELLSIKGSVSKTPFIIGVCISALNIPLVAVRAIILIFTGENEYSQISVQLSTILPIICVFIAVALTLRYRRMLMMREWVSLLLYPVIPVIGAFAQAVFSGVWVSFFGVAISLLIIYMNIQVEQTIKIKEKEAELTESRTAIMLSQIQPHFLYNTLAAIAYLCNRDGAKLAGNVVHTFSKYLRGNMESLSHKRPISFSNELEHTKLYLSIELLQYEERLVVEYDIKADEFDLPALTLQPLVENAVKHGVSKRDKGGTVKISTEETPDSYRVTVSDDGVGFGPQASQDGKAHIGIENVRHRLRSMCGGSLTVESTPGKGTTAIMTIPKT